MDKLKILKRSIQAMIVHSENDSFQRKLYKDFARALNFRRLARCNKEEPPVHFWEINEKKIISMACCPDYSREHPTIKFSIFGQDYTAKIDPMNLEASLTDNDFNHNR